MSKPFRRSLPNFSHYKKAKYITIFGTPNDCENCARLPIVASRTEKSTILWLFDVALFYRFMQFRYNSYISYRWKVSFYRIDPGNSFHFLFLYKKSVPLPAYCFVLFSYFQQLIVSMLIIKNWLLTAFKPWTSGIGSKHSTNCATTTASVCCRCRCGRKSFALVKRSYWLGRRGRYVPTPLLT